jgi:DNA-binding beta-propeller fold protein YncE
VTRLASARSRIRIVARLTLTVVLPSAVLTGCGDGAGPEPLGEAVLVFGGEGSRLSVVDGTTGRIAATPGPVARSKRANALAPDGSTAYVTLLGETHGNELAALSLPAGRFRWRLALTDPGNEAATLVDGLELYGSALATTPDGARLVISHALRPADRARVLDSARVALLDLTTRHVLATVGPLSVNPDGLATLPAGPAAPRGAVLAIGARKRGVSPSLDWLFVLDPETLAATDSAALTPAAADAGGTLRRLVVAPDRRRVYLLARDGELIAYDLVDRAVVGRSHAPPGAWLAVAPDGQRVYASDPGSFIDSPGSGKLFVFDGTLAPLGAIDLGTAAAVNGFPPATHGLAVSRDGARLYVASGTASVGPLYGPQPQRLLVVDVAQRTILHATALGDYGPAGVYVP